MHWRFSTFIALTISIAACAATTQPTSLPTTQPIPREQLNQIYQHELGNLYNAADVDKYYQATLLIERHFAEPEARGEIVKSLENLSLDANLIGRLTRIRLDWPDLQPGIYYINQRVGPHNVRYFLGIPKNYDRATAWPLVLKLPTADAFVADPKPDPIQVTEIYSAWMRDEIAKHSDAICIMPLLNLDELWGPSYAGMNNAIQPILDVANRVNIDPAHVYMVGHSMSAHAAWNLALLYTTYFASFNALAGGASQEWERIRLNNLRSVLPVVWHDADDQLIKIDVARQLVKMFRTQKVDLEYVETKGVGHVPTDAIAEQCYQTMRLRGRNLYPPHITLQSDRPDTMFNRNDWVQIYQPMHIGNEKKLFFNHGSGYMLVYPVAFSVDAALANNQITVTTQNVESMRFYVNDQMIDFTRAVSVVVNHKPRYEAFVKPSIEEMLKDQLFLGRGWRYYTGVIDIDFGK
jgi:hypothetical protein